jgi:hypothetical protein
MSFPKNPPFSLEIVYTVSRVTSFYMPRVLACQGFFGKGFDEEEEKEKA